MNGLAVYAGEVHLGQRVVPQRPGYTMGLNNDDGGSKGGVLGEVLGVRTLHFLGTPKLHKEGKNIVHMRANASRFSSYQLPGPHPVEIL